MADLTRLQHLYTNVKKRPEIERRAIGFSLYLVIAILLIFGWISTISLPVGEYTIAKEETSASVKGLLKPLHSLQKTAGDLIQAFQRMAEVENEVIVSQSETSASVSHEPVITVIEQAHGNDGMSVPEEAFETAIAAPVIEPFIAPENEPSALGVAFQEIIPDSPAGEPKQEFSEGPRFVRVFRYNFKQLAASFGDLYAYVRGRE